MPTIRCLPYLCGLLPLFLLTQGLAAATELTRDDVDFRKEVYVGKGSDRLSYRLFVPLGYDANQKYPLMLWLHSGDGRGSDNAKQLTKENQLGTHFWIAHEVQAKFPAFVLVPQCPSGKTWAEPEFNQPSKWLELTMEALAKVERIFSIDADHVYIGGQGMGGIGVWSLLQSYRGHWAGALLISAYDTFTDIPAIAEVPLWVFQAEADPAVPTAMVRSMIEQLKKAHANVRYSEYHKADSGVANRAFAEPNLIGWLASQKRAASTASQVGTGGSPVSH
jgi:predicted peptidase